MGHVGPRTLLACRALALSMRTGQNAQEAPRVYFVSIGWTEVTRSAPQEESISMLTRTHLLALTVAALTVSATGCILTTSTDGTSVGGAGGSTSNVTSATGTTSSTSTTSSTTTSSSTGGGCIGGNGTGKAEAACDQMAAFPAKCASDNLQPIAVGTCHRGFQIYIPGLWEELQTCFDMIPATTDDTCGTNAVTNTQNCLNQMYASACVNTNADAACDNIAASCSAGDAFETAKCKQDLVPFSTPGLNQYIDCINTHNADPCAGLHATCFDLVQQF